MPLYRVQAALQMDSGIPEDRSINTWHFIADDLTALNLALTSLGTFYTDIDGLLSSSVATTGHVVKAYDMADPEPRAPVQTVTGWSLTTGATGLPPEIALCLSFQAVRQSGQPQARRRGRVYIGPLAQATSTSGGIPTAATLTTLATAGDNLLVASNAAATWSWAVYSRVDQLAISVHDGWVDDAYDVQRRRGLTASTRTTFDG